MCLIALPDFLQPFDLIEEMLAADHEKRVPVSGQLQHKAMSGFLRHHLATNYCCCSDLHTPRYVHLRQRDVVALDENVVA